MTKVLVLSPNLETYLEANNYKIVSENLKTSFKLEKNTDGAPVHFEFSVDVLNFMHKVMLHIIKQGEINDVNKEISKELFRGLRNYVINPKVQNYLISDGNFLKDVKNIFLLSSNNCDLLQIILQFLINLIISNESAAITVYALFLNNVCNFLIEKKCIYESSALLYNMLLHRKEISLDWNTFDRVLELYEEDSSIEFLHFLLETFIASDSFWKGYHKFHINKRLILLAVIRDKQIKGEPLHLSKEGVKVLSSAFISSGKIIFQTVSTEENNLEPYEVSQVLQIISSLCGQESYLKLLQNDKDLLINSGVLLINVHNLGKEFKNNFSSIQNLSELREPDKKIADHPAFGFKADLVRIIGNLCWKNKVMQDLVREAELIPVILDCCNMDARNPFIMQWVILAVRNLCENNLENQKVIASLHLKGTVDSAVLQEMGLTLHHDSDSSLKIVPLDALRNKK